MKWNVDRKFNFGEIANFQDPRPPANIRPSELKRAGERKNFAAPASKRHAHVPVLWGLPRTPSQPYISRPGGNMPIGDQPFKAAFPFFELAKKNRLNARLRLVARSVRRCAAFDPGVLAWRPAATLPHATGNKGVQPACTGARRFVQGSMLSGTWPHSGYFFTPYARRLFARHRGAN